jgi:O-6-methylguanine DNA methyltransferase
MEKIYYSALAVPVVKNVFVASTTKGICMLDFQTSEKKFLKEVRENVSGEIVRDNKKNREALYQIRKYLRGELKRFGCKLDFRGTPFQKKVWAQLMKIPYGETRSYAEIARAIGHPKAFRAVGSANGANPIPIIAPCHRVIESNGGLGGYGHGLPMKKRLLALERTYGSRGIKA